MLALALEQLSLVQLRLLVGRMQVDRAVDVGDRVSHDAFGYLERYGIHFEPIAGLTPGAEPTPADLGRLQELIREEGVTTVFSERLASPAMARTLAEDVGVQTAVLDPVEGLTDETSGSDYVALMEDNLAALQEAGGC